MPYYDALRYDALRQLTHEHLAGAEAERLAPRARDGRVRPAYRLPLAREIEYLRTAHRQAMQRAGYVVVTIRPRR